MNILFVADKIEKLNIKGDSSLVMANAALQKGHQVAWCDLDDVGFALDKVTVTHQRLESVYPPQTAPKIQGFVRDFDLVFIRKDPPFDAHYIRTCWLLSLEEPHVFFANRPSLLVRYHEKVVQMEAVTQGAVNFEDTIPTFVSAKPLAEAYFKEQGMTEVILKPFLGFGGREIEKVSFEAFQQMPESQVGDRFVQPYLNAVTVTGDRRVIFLGGEVIGHFARIPKAGSFVSNLAQGGSAEIAKVSEKENQVLLSLGRFLKQEGIEFAGADIIGERLSEVNITSPTGLSNLGTLEGDNRGAKIIDYFQSKVANG